MQGLLRVDIGIKISHNVEVLQSFEEGNFKSSGAAANQFLRKLLLKADVSVRLPAHKGNPGVAHSLIGAGQGSEGRIEPREGPRRDALRRCHLFQGPPGERRRGGPSAWITLRIWSTLDIELITNSRVFELLNPSLRLRKSVATKKEDEDDEG